MKAASYLLFQSLLQEKGADNPSLTPNNHFESAIADALGYRLIAGIDEAGRGPLAGPVVAAAVILRFDDVPQGIRDSKLLTAKKRETLFAEIQSRSLGVGVGIVGPEEIDIINIRQATLLAMKKAVDAIPVLPEYCIVDGIDDIPIAIPQSHLVGGDRRCLTVAAASIIAKVTRDRIMIDYHEKYPEYGFDKNMGYGTKQHRDALKRVGPSPIHRRSFRGVVLP